MEVRKTFKYRLRGGASGDLPVSESEEKRLFNLVQNLGCNRGNDSTPFIIFDSKQSRILLNLKHLIYCHFLFDAGTWEEKEDMEEEGVTVILADGAELSFGVDADQSDPADKDDKRQFANIISMAETSVEEDELFDFTDEDGEQVFLRADDIAMIKIPLWVVEGEEGSARNLNK